MAIYKGFKIFYLGAGRYRVTIGKSQTSLIDNYDGLKQIIDIIDEVTSLFKRG